VKTAFIFDTETNGLPVWHKPSEDPCQPRITQLAAELCDDDTGETLAAINFIIKPDGWTIPEELQEMTGITHEKAERFGVPMDVALPIFLELWERCDLRVAHNEGFDMRMVRIEIMRHPEYLGLYRHNEEARPTPYSDVWKAGAVFCTQANSINILNLPPTPKMLAAGRTHAKSPNLSEAYRHFTGKDLEGAHNAANDIMACKAVYFGIKALKQ
jgi:DNA polymerase-3 subunit epsilon